MGRSGVLGRRSSNSPASPASAGSARSTHSLESATLGLRCSRLRVLRRGTAPCRLDRRRRSGSGRPRDPSATESSRDCISCSCPSMASRRSARLASMRSDSSWAAINDCEPRMRTSSARALGLGLDAVGLVTCLLDDLLRLGVGRGQHAGEPFRQLLVGVVGGRLGFECARLGLELGDPRARLGERSARAHRRGRRRRQVRADLVGVVPATDRRELPLPDLLPACHERGLRSSVEFTAPPAEASCGTARAVATTSTRRSGPRKQLIPRRRRPRPRDAAPRRTMRSRPRSGSRRAAGW